ncbi:MAG TPA: type II toxin-antitoxin system VapB family antitoxin [Gaiellaceae bacterium]|jgi:antitoxin VapB|nr:type II toxin-antitoxin system VapB family antitoxin [Gaiellaceae bacterium]
MALNIKNAEAERLASELASLTGETKTQAIAVALRERLERLRAAESREDRAARIRRVLEEEIWPLVPADVRGKPLTKAEREEILGYGPEGY